MFGFVRCKCAAKQQRRRRRSPVEATGGASEGTGLAGHMCWCSSVLAVKHAEISWVNPERFPTRSRSLRLLASADRNEPRTKRNTFFSSSSSAKKRCLLQMCRLEQASRCRAKASLPEHAPRCEASIGPRRHAVDANGGFEFAASLADICRTLNLFFSPVFMSKAGRTRRHGEAKWSGYKGGSTEAGGVTGQGPGTEQ